MRNYRPLTNLERMHIVHLIRHLARVARNEDHPMREIARIGISKCMWRWTADGVDAATGCVKYDVLKYDVTLLPSTSAARLRATRGKRGLRHEHIVPRDMLARRIVACDMDIESTAAFLGRYCIGAVLTVEEDRLLRPRKNMPAGWVWKTGDPWERYRAAGIDVAVPDYTSHDRAREDGCHSS